MSHTHTHTLMQDCSTEAGWESAGADKREDAWQSRREIQWRHTHTRAGQTDRTCLGHMSNIHDKLVTAYKLQNHYKWFLPCIHFFCIKLISCNNLYSISPTLISLISDHCIIIFHEHSFHFLRFTCSYTASGLWWRIWGPPHPLYSHKVDSRRQ